MLKVRRCDCFFVVAVPVQTSVGEFKLVSMALSLGAAVQGKVPERGASKEHEVLFVSMSGDCVLAGRHPHWLMPLAGSVDSKQFIRITSITYPKRFTTSEPSHPRIADAMPKYTGIPPAKGLPALDPNDQRILSNVGA
jgi:hypothetical protein